MPPAMESALSLVGERWALLVVREVSLGRHRFDEIQAATGAPRAVLSDRLRRLTAAGILATRSYQSPGHRARSEYVLTAAGVDLLPLLAAFLDWGRRHLAASDKSDQAARDIEYHHVACGGHVTAQLVCDCGQLVSPHDRLIAQINP
jgi:DNA-binding HxlR family transcriptional regulator